MHYSINSKIITKELKVRLLFAGIFLMNALIGSSQIKYIYLNISQPNIEKCVTKMESALDDSNFKIFPNPSKGTFTLEISDIASEKQCNLSIHNISGKEIIKEEIRIIDGLKKTIDLSEYGAGTYILIIKWLQNADFKARLILY